MKHCMFLLLLLSLGACEKDNTKVVSDEAIVESYLTSGAPVEVRISQIIPFNPEAQQNQQTLDKLPVSILYKNQKYALVGQGDGRYTLDPAILMPLPGETYGLEIARNGQIITAETSIPAKPKAFSASASTFTLPNLGGGGFPSFPDPVQLKWSGEAGAYYLVVVKNIEANPTPLFDDVDREDLPNFRSEPVQANSYELRFTNFKFLGTHQLILFRINPEYATLYQNNGDNSLNLAQVPTNIEGGLGIFTGIAAADTLLLEVKK